MAQRRNDGEVFGEGLEEKGALLLSRARGRHPSCRSLCMDSEINVSQHRIFFFSITVFQKLKHSRFEIID